MPRAYASTIIPASLDQVWSYARDFGNLSEWTPAVESSEIENSRPAEAVGCVRRLTLAGGVVLRERLVGLDDAEHRYSYAFVEESPPTRNYLATLEFRAVTSNDSTFAAWWADFDVDASDEAEQVNGLVDNVFTPGLATLRDRFAGT